MVRLRKQGQREAGRLWRQVKADDLDGTFPLGQLELTVSTLQREAARLSSAYLSTFIASELGEPERPPALSVWDKAFGGGDLREALRSAVIKTKQAIGEGDDPREATNRNRIVLVNDVGLFIDTAARESLRQGMEQDDRIVGYQRALKGTCGACAGSRSYEAFSPNAPVVQLMYHPNCQCVAEPVVTGQPPVKVLDRSGTPVEGMAKYDSAIHGSARAALATAERKALDDTLDAIRKAHRWPEDKTLPIRPVDGGSRGSFRHRVGEPQEIGIREGLGAKQTSTSFAHEMGHFLDNLLGKQLLDDGVVASRNFISQAPEFTAAKSGTASAMREFLAVARSSPTMRLAKSSLEKNAPKDWAYVNAPEEIWARAYSQWITKRASPGEGSWEIGDFGPVSKALEKVLRAAKLR
jgi:hypothetical protein